MNRYDTYTLLELSITTHNNRQADLREHLMEMHVFSSVFDISMSGQLVIHDSQNLIENAPIIGGEKVTLRWRTNGREKETRVDFRVYKIGKRDVTSNVQGYVLYLDSENGYNSIIKQVSASFRGSYSECVKNVLTGHLETTSELDVEDSSGAISSPFISPNWNPLQICNWMASRAMDADNNPFLFYENESGLTFKSLSTLYSDDIFTTFVYEPQEAFGYDSARRFHNIHSFTANGSRNAIERDVSGITDSDTIFFDFTKKTVETQENRYNQHTAPMMDSERVDYDTTSVRRHSTFVHTQSDLSHLGDYNRRVAYGMMPYTSFTCLMVADSAMRVGQMIQFDVPSAEPLNNESKVFEKRTSGRYLISAIKVTFTRQQVTSGVEICKDSFGRVGG